MSIIPIVILACFGVLLVVTIIGIIIDVNDSDGLDG
jgi:hypothetical protein